MAAQELQPFEQLGLIGCGLMGGSFALALKKAGLVKRVVGYSKSPSTTERARQMGVIDVEAPSALLAAAGADLVLLAVPVAATEATLKSIKHLVTPGMMIMDVGSTKVDVVHAARSALRDQLGSFVPAHPIAGKEVSGVEQGLGLLQVLGQCAFRGRQDDLCALVQLGVGMLDARCGSCWAAACAPCRQKPTTAPLPRSATCRICWPSP